MGGSSKKQTVGYKYYAGEHLALCRGPIDKITEIIVDDRIAWTGEAEDEDTVTINAPGLFGGEKREGGISGAVDICFGGPEQDPNTYLQSMLGSVMPAFRGIAAVILKQCYLGNNPYLKPWSFRAKRIHVRGMDGDEQWYDEKAEVFSPATQAQMQADIDAAAIARAAADAWIEGFDDDWDNSFEYAVYDENDDVVTNWTSAPQPFHNSNGSGTFVESHDYWEIHQRRLIEIPYFADGYQVTIRMNLVSDDGGRARWDGFGLPQTEPSYAEGGRRHHKFILYHVPPPEYSWTAPGIHPFGTAIKNAKADDFVTDYGSDSQIYSKVNFVSVTAQEPPLPVYEGDMNPAHIIREDITDPKADGGQGYQDADVDDTYFMASADTLFDEGMGMSLLWDTPSDHEAFIELVLRHINGALRLDHATGKFQLKLLRDDYEVGDLVTLDGNNISKVEDFSRPSFGDLINTVIVKYWDAATNTTQSISADDPVLVQQQGGVNSTTIEYLGFTNADIASKAASRDLQSLSAPLASFTVYADRSAATLNIGDPFIVDLPDEGINQMVVRVLSGSFGDGKSHAVKLQVAQDVFAFPATAVVAEEDAGWVNPATDPVAADYRVVVEAPYYELVQRFGQTAVDDIIATNEEIGYLLVAAVRPANEINADFVVDSGAGYDLTTSVAMDFCGSATIVDAVDYMDTEWAIESGVDLDLVTVGTHAKINDELFRVDAIDVDAGTLTVGRGVLDTVPAQHLAGARILFWDDYSETDGTEYADGEEVAVKILPATGKGVLDIDDANFTPLAFDQRAARPYPPADVQISGAYYPAILTSSINITWVGRDRIQQTSGTLYDYFDANIGPEAGVTYNGYVYDDDTDALLYSATGVASPWSVPVAGDANVRIELESERAGITSFQRFSHVALLANGYGGATRITEDADTRITQSGDTRITED
tara:strand:- start:11584 stop:14397 length:2814 start_codon:yes stop_codon:yes gene_type:complete